MTPTRTSRLRRSTGAALVGIDFVAAGAFAAPVVAAQQSGARHRPERLAAHGAPVVRQMAGIDGESTSRRHPDEIESLGASESPTSAQVTQ